VIDRTELMKILKRLGTQRPASFFESQHLEFKQAARSDRETLTLLADAAVCFANAEGGTIVLGVNDRATNRAQAFVGVDHTYSVDVLRRGIFDRTTPHLTVIAYEVEEADARLVVIDVPPGVMPHANTAGLATRRLGNECRPFTPDQQREVLAARGHFDWSAEASGVAPRDLSQIEFERLREMLREGGNHELADLRDAALLDALRLIADDGLVTHAGLLILGSEADIRAHAPNYGYSYQYRVTAGTEAATRFRQTRSLIAGIETVLDAVQTRVEIQPLNLAGGAQLQLADYPLRAVRELVINGFIHRSYTDAGTVDVEHTAERLVVVSPGRLVAGVTPDNILKHPSTPRNRLLAEAVATLRLAERTGQGVDRAYREMLRSGKEPPLFEEVGLTTRALLSGGVGNDSFVRFVADLPSELAGDVEVLLALSVLRSRTSIDAKRLATVIQGNVIEAQDVLERLAADDVAIIEPTRGTVRRHFPTYRLRSEQLASLARAVSYHRRTPDETDAKVIAHIAEYGFITNRTLQRMFNINVFAARNLLSDLQQRGVLAKIGDARGGPGVRYGRGAAFPK
jgi:ATP-dependent DNA helicase RecG